MRFNIMKKTDWRSEGNVRSIIKKQILRELLDTKNGWWTPIDLSTMLCVNVSTIKGCLSELRKDGIVLSRRGYWTLV